MREGDGRERVLERVGDGRESEIEGVSSGRGRVRESRGWERESERES